MVDNSKRSAWDSQGPGFTVGSKAALEMSMQL